MSLILDALRKSDDQRNQSSAPSVASPTAQAPSAAAPRWIWPVVALLAINALVLVWVLTSRQETSPTSVEEPEAVVEARAAQPVAEPVVEPTRRAEVRSLLAETIDEAREARRETTTSTVAASLPEEGNASAASTPPPESNASSAPQIDTYQLGQAVADWQWPALTLELHVYTDDPSTRFGFINGQKITEGGRLSEGPYVAEISRQGVILEFRSRRLLLKP